MIKYYKLFDLLNRRGMKKTDLLKIISSPTLAKLSKGETIKTDIIDKICEYLNVQPGDIMEYTKYPMNEDALSEFCNRYADFYSEIPKSEMMDIAAKHFKKKRNGWEIDQYQFIEVIKKLAAERHEKAKSQLNNHSMNN